jgi:hypothetical protein
MFFKRKIESHYIKFIKNSIIILILMLTFVSDSLTGSIQPGIKSFYTRRQKRPCRSIQNDMGRIIKEIFCRGFG